VTRSGPPGQIPLRPGMPGLDYRVLVYKQPMPGNLALTSSTPTDTHMLQDHRRRRTWPTAAAWWGACFPLDSERHSSAPPPRGCIRDLTNCPSPSSPQDTSRTSLQGRDRTASRGISTAVPISRCAYGLLPSTEGDKAAQPGFDSRLSSCLHYVSVDVLGSYTAAVSVSATRFWRAAAASRRQAGSQQRSDSYFDLHPAHAALNDGVYSLASGDRLPIKCHAVVLCAHGSCILGSRTRASGLKSAAAAAAG